MKLALLADLHLRGQDHQVKSQVLRRALGEMRDRGVEWVLDAGDTFDSPKVLDRHASTGTIYRAFLDPVEAVGIPWLILEGNHTMGGPREQGALAALQRRNRDLIQVVTRPEIVTRHRGLSGPSAGVAVACLPWASRAHWMARPEVRALPPEEQAQRWQAAARAVLQGLRQELAREDGFRILLGHVEVAGSINPYKFVLPGSTWCFSPADLDQVGADLVALGHYHMRQGHYLGAFTQLNHGEEGNPGGWLFVDTATGQREFVDVDAPRYFTVRAEAYRPEDFREWDHVRVIGRTPPDGDLPPNVRFEAEAEERGAALRDGAEGLDPGAPLPGLVEAWLRAQGQDDPDVTPLLALIDQVERDAGGAPGGSAAGSLSRVRSVRVAGFGPHVDTRCDFTRGDWWAIMGRNGAGKTFLLEAPIACLYGTWAHPYRGTLYDTLTATEGVIEVEFDAEGSTWRAFRRLRRTGKTQTAEALLTRLEPGGREVPIAGPKVKEFEAAVEGLVGPLNLVLGSIFLSQKAEGDLVSADAAARKEFMRRFLQLDRFDPRAEAAKVRANRLEGELAGHETRLQALPELREAQPRLVEEAEARAAEVATIEEAITAAEAEVQAILDRGQELLAQHQAREGLLQARADADQAVATTREEVGALEGRVAGYEAQLAREPQLREQADQLPGVRARLEELRAAAATRQAAARAHAEAVRQRDGLQAQVEALEGRVAGYEAQLAREPQLRRQVAGLPEIRAALESHRARTAARAEALVEQGRLEAEVQRHQAALDQAGRDLRREVDQTAQALQALQEDIARCEERGRGLAAAGCAPDFLSCPLIDGARADVARAADLAEQARALEETRDDLELTLFECDFAHEIRASLAAALATRCACQVPPPADTAELPALQARERDLLAVERELAGLDQVAQARAQAAADLAARQAALLEAEAAVLFAVVPEAPDPGEEARLREREAALATADRELGGLDQVRQVLDQTRGDLVARRAALATAEARLEEATRAAAAAEDVAGALEAQRALHRERREALAGRRRELGDAQVALGQARQAVEEGARRIAELEALEASLVDTRTRRDGFRLLQAACGKDGIPQLLISAAIPAIERTVQEVCRVDFGGAFSLRFDTVRTLKTGASRESFDVLFSRPGAPEYDARSCSGGEEAAVRAAIRVALVLYQAQRASGSYRVCWLDEPAAHQDSENAEATLRMLDRLRDRFSQAFVVSHDDELLADFEHRVELPPGPGGTRVAGQADSPAAAAPTLEGVAA